jgi:hypothetical protein
MKNHRLRKVHVMSMLCHYCQAKIPPTVMIIPNTKKLMADFFLLFVHKRFAFYAKSKLNRLINFYMGIRLIHIGDARQ